MPNDLSVDINANQRLDIMRCKMKAGEDAYMNLARSKEEITVEIFREKTPLIVFTVPWSTRVQSKFLSHPRDVPDDASMGMSTSPWASKFDPWMGFDRETPGVWKREKLFMCVPGLETPPSRKVCTVGITNLLLLELFAVRFKHQSLTNTFCPLDIIRFLDVRKLPKKLFHINLLM
jgi:hypothetical protein